MPLQIAETTGLVHGEAVGEQLTGKRFILMKVNESADHQIISDMTCQLGTEQNRSEKRYRIVSFHDNNGNLIKVVTDLHSLSVETIAAIYKARWQIETFFRWVKQNLNVPTLFGTTKNVVFNQLFAALIACVLLRWMFQGASRIFDSKAISFVSFQRQLIENQLSKDWVRALNQFLKKLLGYGVKSALNCANQHACPFYTIGNLFQ